MQALEFSNAFKEITRELKVVELIQAIQPLINVGQNAQVDEPSKQQLLTLLFDANAGYRQLRTKPAERELLDALPVGEMFEPSRLVTLVSSIQGAGQTQNIWNNAAVFRGFFTFFELLRWLHIMQITSDRLLEKEKIGDIDPSEEIVEFQLIEYEGETGIDPQRLKAFVDGVTELYTVVAMVLNKPNHFTLRYVDSGSSFLAGLLSEKAVAETVKTLFNQYFDRVRFWKYDKHDRKLESISKTLDIVAKIHQQVEDGALPEENGRNLTERTLGAMEKLTDIGVTPAVRGTVVSVERQQFLNEVRKMKMLTGTTEQSKERAEASGQVPDTEAPESGAN